MLSLHTLLVLLLVAPGLVTGVVPLSVTGLEGVLSLFQDRVEVGLCRARCLQTGREVRQQEVEQCWTVCHLLSADPPTWTRVCQEGAGQVCSAGCPTACSHFTGLPSPALQEDSSPAYRLTRQTNTCSLVLPTVQGGTVFLVVGEDSRGDWYELSQTPHTSLDLVPFIVNLVIIKISHSGQLSVRQMPGCTGHQPSSWPLHLVSLT